MASLQVGRLCIKQHHGPWKTMRLMPVSTIARGQNLRLCRLSSHQKECGSCKISSNVLLRDYSTSVRHITQIPVLQKLFHINTSNEGTQIKFSGSYERKTTPYEPKIQDNEVKYHYNKEMMSASLYLQREKEKLTSQPRTEKELYHAKYTPRLFYLEREAYSNTAACLPRTRAEITSEEVMESSHEDFLNRLIADKATHFPMSFLTEGIRSLVRRSDDWLIDLNNDTRFLRLSLIIRAMCAKMSNVELAEVLTFLARVQVRTRNIVLPTLYEECCQRVENMDLGSRLLFLDSWRMIGYPVPKLSKKVFAACRDSVPDLSTPELLQLIYLIGENRGAPDGLEKDLVNLLPNHLTSLSLTELGTVCTGLFKSVSSPPTADLMMQISDHVCSSDIQTVHSFFVVGILKHFRRQYTGYQHFFQYIANAVAPFLKLYPLMSCMQILLTYATMHVCHPQLCDTLAYEISQKADQWRSKDATKILWSYGTLQYLPDKPDFLPSVLDKLVSLQGEMEEFPINLVSSLLSLAFLQLYPWELINRVFSKEFVEIAIGQMDKTGMDIRRDLLLLDRSLEIDCPEYNGNRLDESLMLTSDIDSSIVPSISQQLTGRPEVRFIAGLVRALVGLRENYKIHPILPHFNTLDIEVRLNKHNQPIPFEKQHSPSSALSQNIDADSPRTHNGSRKPTNHKNAVALSSDLIANLTHGGITSVEPTLKRTRIKGRTGEGIRDRVNEGMDKHQNMKRMLQKPVPAPTDSDEKWLAIVVWARNHCHYGGNKLLGQHAMKRRQLELLGYHVIDIPFQDWNPLMKRRDEQENLKYMRRKIFNGSHTSL